MAQYLIVGLIVLAAMLYSVWKLMPAAVRGAAAARLASLARRCGLGDEKSQRLRARLATASGCGQCASCKGCASPASKRAP